MLTAYIDDSGSDWQSPSFLLAGYVSTEAGWRRFETMWNSALLAGPSPLPFLKASEAESRKGAFEGWTQEARDERVSELAAIVNAHALFAAVSTMEVERYNSIVKGPALAHLRIRKVGNTAAHPYFFLLSDLVFSILAEAVKLGERVSFVLDRQPEKEKRARDAFPNVSSFFDVVEAPQLKRLIGELRFADERELPLQAADMLAWHENRRRSSGRREPERAIYAQLDSIPIKRTEASEEYLRNVTDASVRRVDCFEEHAKREARSADRSS